jgi:hypothetical protein
MKVRKIEAQFLGGIVVVLVVAYLTGDNPGMLHWGDNAFVAALAALVIWCVMVELIARIQWRD